MEIGQDVAISRLQPDLGSVGFRPPFFPSRSVHGSGQEGILDFPVGLGLAILFFSWDRISLKKIPEKIGWEVI